MVVGVVEAVVIRRAVHGCDFQFTNSRRPGCGDGIRIPGFQPASGLPINGRNRLPEKKLDAGPDNRHGAHLKYRHSVCKLGTPGDDRII